LKKQVIIVAGGKGERMGSDLPKQFIVVVGKPVLMHTIEKFHSFSDKMKIVLVLPEPYIEYWKSQCEKFGFKIAHRVVEGGKTRFHSVKNGLNTIDGNSLVAVHDGVRPLVSYETLERVFSRAGKKGNAVPVVPVNESVRKRKRNKSKTVNRKNYFLVQTPQCFTSEILKKAYEQDYNENFTDDASVLEAMGIKIHLVEGNEENIKITRPFDLKMAECLLREG